MAQSKLAGFKDAGELRFNRVHPVSNAFISCLFVVLGLMAIVPFIFVVIISFSSEESIVTNGYSFIPAQWSTYTYEYLWQTRDEIFFLLSHIGNRHNPGNADRPFSDYHDGVYLVPSNVSVSQAVHGSRVYPQALQRRNGC